MGELVRQLAVNELHPELRSRGFIRDGSTWNRRASGFVQVINVQSSQWNSRGNESCTVNLGIFWEKVRRICWQKPPSRFAREVDCLVRVRIGRLLDEKRDRWWALAEAEDVKPASEEILELLESDGLPWLENFKSLRELHDLLAAGEDDTNVPGLRRIYLAIVKAEMGDKKGANAILLERTSQAWQERAEIVREALQLGDAA